MQHAPEQYRALQSVEFDHVFLVDNFGNVRKPARALSAPTVEHDEECDILIDSVPWTEYRQWRPFTGRTCQYGYSGAVMHPSEYVGNGGLADDILGEPGHYVLVPVRDGADLVGWAALAFVPPSDRVDFHL